MTETILDAPAKVIDYVDQVRRLADANRDALGFLSATAYEEAAMKGCLWVAVSGTAKRLRGYLFFGVRYGELKTLGCIGGANLVSAQELPYDKLRLIVERAFALEKP